MMASVQRRSGPMNVGWFGLLQALDDGLKLVKKELIIPKKSNTIVWLLVPILFFDFSLILWVVIALEDFGCKVDFSFAILFQLFFSNLSL
jgi:NADH-quinone oxidoreductase subunit H